MANETNHNKIINQAARSVLKKNGMFQKGQSRTWIDDNGWFFIVVEFQPSNWNKGSYLNVGINYLWTNKEYLSFDYGSRENGFVAFNDNNEEFYKDMVHLAELAETKVAEYRKFQNIEYAKEKIINRNGYTSVSHEIYNKLMICGMAKDSRAKSFYNKLLKETQHSMLAYEVEYFKELSEEISFVINDPELFYDYLCKKIIKQREYWHSKSSMKKLQLRITES